MEGDVFLSIRTVHSLMFRWKYPMNECNMVIYRFLCEKERSKDFLCTELFVSSLTPFMLLYVA